VSRARGNVDGKYQRRNARPSGYAFDDLAKIGAPTLILVGDRDQFCSVEEAAQAFRSLRHGELAVLARNRARDHPTRNSGRDRVSRRQLAQGG
jgi:pimeloyl-ACP methyl ester carboxylesterase